MSYNGSGTFNINSTGQPVVAGTVITASAFNALTTDLATGLTTAITKDGQTTTTARITFAQGFTSSLVTDSSSTSTGSIITAGGVGIAKALYVGTTATISSLSSASATALTLQSAGTTAITVDTSQNVGIGTASPISKLTVNSGATGVQAVFGYGSGLNYIAAGSNTAATYQTRLGYDVSNEVGYIQAYAASGVADDIGINASGGNVGIGTSSPTGKFQVVGSGGNAYIDNNGFVNSTQALDDATAGGRFVGYSNQGKLGEIAIEQTTISTKGGYIRLSTCASGSNSPTERMRIDSSGNLLVGKTSQSSSSQGFEVISSSGSTHITSSATTNTLELYQKTTAGGYALLNGYYDVSSSKTNSITVYTNGNIQNLNNSYGSLSDVKIKENIVDATPKLADLMQVKVRNYNLKSDQTHKQIGVIAQELEEVFPAMVEENIDRDEDGNNLGTTTKGVKYSVFVPMLIKAIQELKAINDTQAETINALTARIVALENA